MVGWRGGETHLVNENTELAHAGGGVAGIGDVGNGRVGGGSLGLDAERLVAIERALK